MKLKNNSWLPGYIALGITWGSSFLFIKWGLITLSPIGVAFFRGFVGGISLLIYSLVTKQKLPRKIKELAHISVVSLTLNSIPGFLFAIGETKVSSVTAGIINATTPLMTILVIIVAFREQKINSNQWLGMLIGFFGVLLVTDVFSNKGHDSISGILILLLATLCYGISMPYNRKYVSSMIYSSTALATVQVTLSALFLAPFAIFTNSIPHPWSAKSIWGILLLGSIGTGFAYIWNYRNVKIAGSAIASTVTFITPVVATILGFLFLKEKLHLIQYFGGLVILFSAALIQNRIKVFSGKKPKE